MSRSTLAIAVLLALASFAAAPPARAEMLPDSTTVDAWALPNGLQVRVRDVPGARQVALTLAYRAGTAIESGSLPDLAPVLAQVQFTAPVGDVPERPTSEMSSIRPLGWGMTTNPHVALLTEVAAGDRFAGLLREVAARARGVQVTDSCLAHVLAAVRRDGAQRRYGSAEPALYDRVRDLALGASEDQVLERTRGRALSRLTPAGVDSLLKRYYVASNASLALVGDFGGMDLHALVEREFGAVPAGQPQPDPPAERVAPGARVAIARNLPSPMAVVGIVAPALEDSMHASFYLNSLVLGGWWSRQHADDDPHMDSHFQYAVLDEPELARFDVAVPEDHASVAAVTSLWDQSSEEYAQLLITRDIFDLFKVNVRWLLGGEMSRDQRRQAVATPSFLSTLATTTATRAIWKGDAFWAGYRQRFEDSRVGPTTFHTWLEDPAHQAVLVLKPKP